jgi:hypothetical protein
MYTLLLIAGLVFMVSGIVLTLMSLREKKAGSPRLPSFNPRLWFTPIWKQREWFTPSGYRKYMLGALLIGLGAFMSLVTSLTSLLS